MRSLPNPAVPRLPVDDDTDRVMRESRNRRAMMFADMEDISDECLQLADDFERNGVVVDIADEDDSFVHEVENAAAAARR